MRDKGIWNIQSVMVNSVTFSGMLLNSKSSTRSHEHEHLYCTLETFYKVLRLETQYIFFYLFSKQHGGNGVEIVAFLTFFFYTSTP